MRSLLDDSHHERNDSWLRTELDRIWERHFSDVERVNRVDISFARSWKYRLGMIALSESGRSTYIGINQLLRLSEVPDCIVTITISHELVHYSHGFGSPLPRLHDDPHAGDIVTKDLRRRGLGRVLGEYWTWMADQWFPLYARYRASGNRSTRQRSARRVEVPVAASRVG